MRKKVASLKYFELADGLDVQISALADGEQKKAFIMVASQLLFYAGETGLKFLLGMGNYGIPREDILLELRTYEGSKISEYELKKIEILYLDLLPLSVGGSGLRNMGAYVGKNSGIYQAHREFAQFVISLIER